jgi:hypothetical protein
MACRGWTHAYIHTLSDDVPCLMKVSIVTGDCMQGMGIDDPIEFDYMDPPEHDKIVAALRMLYLFGALDVDGKVCAHHARVRVRLMRKKRAFVYVSVQKQMCVCVFVLHIHNTHASHTCVHKYSYTYKRPHTHTCTYLLRDVHMHTCCS